MFPASGSAPRRPRKWTAEEDAQLRHEVQTQVVEGEVKDWCRIADQLPGRTNKDCRKRWHNSVAGGLKKGQWAKPEDLLLGEGVERYGQRWTLVADVVGSRSADQCAKRWQQSLDPDLDRSEWREDEDQILMQAVQQLGRHWKEIQHHHFPGRSKNSIKNRYTVLQRRLQHHHGLAPPAEPSSTPAASELPTPARADDEYMAAYSEPVYSASDVGGGGATGFGFGLGSSSAASTAMVKSAPDKLRAPPWVDEDHAAFWPWDHDSAAPAPAGLVSSAHAVPQQHPRRVAAAGRAASTPVSSLWTWPSSPMAPAAAHDAKPHPAMALDASFAAAPPRPAADFFDMHPPPLATHHTHPLHSPPSALPMSTPMVLPSPAAAVPPTPSHLPPTPTHHLPPTPTHHLPPTPTHHPHAAFAPPPPAPASSYFGESPAAAGVAVATPSSSSAQSRHGSNAGAGLPASSAPDAEALRQLGLQHQGMYFADMA